MIENIEFVSIDENRVAVFIEGLTDYQFEKMYNDEKEILNRLMLSKNLENREAILINASYDYVEENGLNGVLIVNVKGEHASKKTAVKSMEELFKRS